MRVVISFNWKGQNFEKFVDFNILKDDINEKDDFWGEFICGGNVYQFQIWWNAQQIIIFNKGGIEPIDYVNNFSISFSHTFNH
jgi:hypothetical protein